MNRSHCLTLALTCGAAMLAQAEQTPYYVGVSEAVTHDANLLQLSDGQTAPAGYSKSDTTMSTSLLAGIDQPFGRQRGYGNLTLSTNHLSQNSIFNNQSYSLSGGLDWSTVDRISGSVKLNANRNLARFNADNLGLVTIKNVQSTRQLDALVKVGMATELSFEGGAGYRSVDYTATAYETRAFRQNNVSLGVRYRPSAASTFGATLRDAQGRYPKFFILADGTFQADSFTRRDIDFDVNLEPMGTSTFYARISPGKISYDVATQSDFSGVTGLAEWVWRPTGKLRLDTRLSRDPSQDSYFLANGVPNATVDYSRVTNSASTRADYDVTAKIALNATLSWFHRSLAESNVTGSDRTTSASLGLVWTPARSLQFGCNVVNFRRHGQLPLSSNVGDTTVSCYAQGTLQ